MRIYFCWIQMSSFDCVPDMQFAISCIDGCIAVPCRLPPAPPCRCCRAARPAAFAPLLSRLHFSCPDTHSVNVSALGNLCPSSLAMNENSAAIPRPIAQQSTHIHQCSMYYMKQLKRLQIQPEYKWKLVWFSYENEYI